MATARTPDLETIIATRDVLHRVATHVLARRRHDATGRFGLRATPGGIGTPAFGPPDAVEVVRLAGPALLHERGGEVRARRLDRSTLAELAALVGVDLTAELSVGRDTPAVGAVDEPLTVDAGAVAVLAEWYQLGWAALDELALEVDRPAPVQLWPEHFDASLLCFVGPGAEDRCDLGASPGDHHHQEPYLYVGPWGSRRPGDPAFWNAGFGALMPRSAVAGVDDALTFFREGMARLTT